MALFEMSMQIGERRPHMAAGHVDTRAFEGDCDGALEMSAMRPRSTSRSTRADPSWPTDPGAGGVSRKHLGTRAAEIRNRSSCGIVSVQKSISSRLDVGMEML